MFFKVRIQQSLRISLVWVRREKQDSKKTLNLWHENLISGDTGDQFGEHSGSSVSVEIWSYFGSKKFEMLLRHPGEDVKQAGESLRESVLREDFKTGDTKSGH